MTTVTPMSVEKRLVQLSGELDVAITDLVSAEHGYYQAKGAYEVAVAKARLSVGEKFAAAGTKATVQEKEDEATMRTQEELLALCAAEAIVKSARANVKRLEIQVDIARSVGTSVRASMEALT